MKQKKLVDIKKFSSNIFKNTSKSERIAYYLFGKNPLSKEERMEFSVFDENKLLSLYTINEIKEMVVSLSNGGFIKELKSRSAKEAEEIILNAQARVCKIVSLASLIYNAKINGMPQNEIAKKYYMTSNEVNYYAEIYLFLKGDIEDFPSLKEKNSSVKTKDIFDGIDFFVVDLLFGKNISNINLARVSTVFQKDRILELLNKKDYEFIKFCQLNTGEKTASKFKTTVPLVIIRKNEIREYLRNQVQTVLICKDLQNAGFPPLKIFHLLGLKSEEEAIGLIEKYDYLCGKTSEKSNEQKNEIKVEQKNEYITLTSTIFPFAENSMCNTKSDNLSVDDKISKKATMPLQKEESVVTQIDAKPKNDEQKDVLKDSMSQNLINPKVVAKQNEISTTADLNGLEGAGLKSEMPEDLLNLLAGLTKLSVEANKLKMSGKSTSEIAETLNSSSLEVFERFSEMYEYLKDVLKLGEDFFHKMNGFISLFESAESRKKPQEIELSEDEIKINTIKNPTISVENSNATAEKTLTQTPKNDKTKKEHLSSQIENLQTAETQVVPKPNKGENIQKAEEQYPSQTEVSPKPEVQIVSEETKSTTVQNTNEQAFSQVKSLNETQNIVNKDLKTQDSIEKVSQAKNQCKPRKDSENIKSTTLSEVAITKSPQRRADSKVGSGDNAKEQNNNSPQEKSPESFSFQIDNTKTQTVGDILEFYKTHGVDVSLKRLVFRRKRLNPEFKELISRLTPENLFEYTSVKNLTMLIESEIEDLSTVAKRYEMSEESLKKRNVTTVDQLLSLVESVIDVHQMAENGKTIDEIVSLRGLINDEYVNYYLDVYRHLFEGADKPLFEDKRTKSYAYETLTKEDYRLAQQAMNKPKDIAVPPECIKAMNRVYEANFGLVNRAMSKINPALPDRDKEKLQDAILDGYSYAIETYDYENYAFSTHALTVMNYKFLKAFHSITHSKDALWVSNTVWLDQGIDPRDDKSNSDTSTMAMFVSDGSFEKMAEDIEKQEQIEYTRRLIKYARPEYAKLLLERTKGISFEQMASSRNQSRQVVNNKYHRALNKLKNIAKTANMVGKELTKTGESFQDYFERKGSELGFKSVLEVKYAYANFKYLNGRGAFPGNFREFYKTIQKNADVNNSTSPQNSDIDTTKNNVRSEGDFSNPQLVLEKEIKRANNSGYFIPDDLKSNVITLNMLRVVDLFIDGKIDRNIKISD